MKKLTTVVAFIVVLSCSNAQSFQIDTLRYNGDVSQLINIVVLSDGYQVSELDQFVMDADGIIEDLFNTKPFKQYKNYFNVFAIRVPSNESGAKHPGTATDVSEPVNPILEVDNYFGSTFDFAGIHRLLVPASSFQVYNVLAANFPLYDQVIVLVNSPYYGGSGGAFATASLHSSASEVAIHEIGHSFSKLKDEYYAGDIYAAEAINMTQETDPDSVKWVNWMGSIGVGIYQHCCGGNSSQWRRPHQNCKMKSLNQPFCAVCIEGTIERIHLLTNALRSYTPITSSFETDSLPIEFSIETTKPVPNTLKNLWVLNGEILENSSDTLFVQQEQLISGINSLSVLVEDTTEMLRIDDHVQVHADLVMWTFEYIENAPTKVRSYTEKIEFAVFPNPSTDALQVKMETDILDGVFYELIDINGKLIWGGKARGTITSIPIGNVSAGMYFLQVIKDGQLIASEQIVKAN